MVRVLRIADVLQRLDGFGVDARLQFPELDFLIDAVKHFVPQPQGGDRTHGHHDAVVLAIQALQHHRHGQHCNGNQGQ